jgi:hypothetical protein
MVKIDSHPPKLSGVYLNRNACQLIVLYGLDIFARNQSSLQSQDFTVSL